MKHTSRTNASNLFLLELIISILFFSAASAACIQMFVKSHLLSTDARELNRSVIEVSSIAELTGTAQNIHAAAENILLLYPHAEDMGNDRLEIYYDRNFAPASQTDYAYKMEIRLTQDNTLLSAEISMSKPEKAQPIYHLDIVHHTARRDLL